MHSSPSCLVSEPASRKITVGVTMCLIPGAATLLAFPPQKSRVPATECFDRIDVLLALRSHHVPESSVHQGIIGALRNRAACQETYTTLHFRRALRVPPGKNVDVRGAVSLFINRVPRPRHRALDEGEYS